jgi:hypothetical protein
MFSQRDGIRVATSGKAGLLTELRPEPEVMGRCSALSRQIADKISEHGLTPCHYVSLHCRKDGDIRIALEETPASESYRCPLCQAPCRWTSLGEGGTRRLLPFFGRPQSAYSFQETERRFWQDLKDSRSRA